MFAICQHFLFYCWEVRRRKERMMSRCFTWFPISGLGEPNIYHYLGDFQECGDFTWKYDVEGKFTGK